MSDHLDYMYWTDEQWALWHTQTATLPIELLDQLSMACQLLTQGRYLNHLQRRCWEELRQECQPYLEAVHATVTASKATAP